MLIVIAVLLLLFVLSPVAGIIVVAAALAFETVELLFWRRVLRGRRAVTGVEGMVGESGVVVERCDPAGTVRVRGHVLRNGDPRHAITSRVAYVPEDRLGTGVAPGLSVASNVVLKSYRGAPVSSGPMLRFRRIRELAEGVIERYDVRTSGPQVPAWQLSGGNLQKVVLAREFSGEPAVLVAASPTRGLDVSGIETVHSYLRDAAARGVGILLISEDLDEILALADRIAVMYEGAVVGERDARLATVEDLGLLMAGGEDED